MRASKNAAWLFAGIASLSLAMFGGCNRAADEQGPEVEGATETSDAHDEHDHAGEHVDGDHAHDEHVHGPEHGGWWCYEHAIPEEECSMCDADVAAEFKAKGDWCEEHQRADSQCFICHPENKEKFLALYVAKYGEQPPTATEDSPAENE